MPFTKKTAKAALRKRWDKTPLRPCPRCGTVHRCRSEPKAKASKPREE